VSVVDGGSRPSDSTASLRRRDAIAEATIALLRESGASDVSVAEIAARAEVSVATVYNLVGRRDRILAGVLDRYVARMGEALDAGRRDPARADSVITPVEVVQIAIDESLTDPIPLRTVLRELGPLHLAANKGAGIEAYLEPALLASGLDTREAAETARLIVYGFRGVLLSWAHGLVTDEEFATDTLLTTARIVEAAVIAHGGVTNVA